MVILVGGLELLVLTLPGETIVRQDGPRPHIVTSAFVDHQVTIVDVISCAVLL